MSRAPVLEPKIRAGLQLIRLRQRRMAWILVTFVPLALLALTLPPFFPELELPAIVALLAYGVLMLVYSLHVALTDCPRCDGFYHFAWWGNPFTRRCLNCGLRLKALSEDG